MIVYGSTELLPAAKLKATTFLLALGCFVPLAAPPLMQALSASPTTIALTVTTREGYVTKVRQANAITLTAAVKSGGEPVTKGQVDFCDAEAKYCTDIHLLGMAQLNAQGRAVLRILPGPGDHIFRAKFIGTNGVAPSISSAATISVTALNRPETFTTMTSAVPGNAANTYTIKTTVTGNANGAPTGLVLFRDVTPGLTSESLGQATLQPDDTKFHFAGLAISPDFSSDIFNVPGVVVADFNGDGIPDLAEIDGNNVRILLGKGDGTFPRASYAIAPLDAPYSKNLVDLTVADFNGDGILDLAFGESSVFYDVPPTSGVFVLLGNGDGTFRAAAGDPTASEAALIAVADFNGDGIPDIATVSPVRGNHLNVLLGNGDGSFHAAARNFPLGNAPVALATGDFNGDGKTDIAVVDQGSDSLSILLGEGNGEFETIAGHATGHAPSAIAVADFNGDGKLDLAITNSLDNTVSVLLGNGDGDFKAADKVAVGHAPSTIAVADFNEDGRADLAVTNADDNTLSILVGNGNGGFTAAETVANTAGFLAGDGVKHPSVLRGLAVADLNGDGRPDLVAGDDNTGQLTVLVSAKQAANATIENLALFGGEGLHLIDASYLGDRENNASSSATIELAVTTSSFVINGPNVSIVAGKTAAVPITLTPQGGFSGEVALSCFILQSETTNPPTCAISSSVLVSGSKPSAATLTVSTNAATTPSSSTFPYQAEVIAVSGELGQTAIIPIVVTAPAK